MTILRQGLNLMNAISFLKEVYEQLRQVTWPTRRQTIKFTALVVIVSVAVGLFLGGLDYILTKVTAILIQKYGR